MIAALRGVLEEAVGDAALISVGGVVFRLHVTKRAILAFGEPGTPVFVPTYLHLRDDSVSLYGFADQPERELFQRLISVTGVGPRLAITLLSSVDPARLVRAIESEDPALLAGVPGIGKRISSRIVLELKGKIGDVRAYGAPRPARGELASVQAALTQLGYGPGEVQEALAALPPGIESDLESAIRASLRHLAERTRARGR